VFADYRIRDPLHDVIEFQAEEFENALWRALQTRPFQRLRRVKQLGFSDLVFPGATHSRFAHSVGVFHTARQLMKVIEKHLGMRAFEPSKARLALAACLVHDLGHGPFSHAFEDVGRRLGLKLADHERVSDLLIRSSEISDAWRQLGSGFANDVADLIKGPGPGNLYSAVVSSQFDADRLDYMRRDRLMTGTQHAAIDFPWLLANLEVGEVPYGVDQEALGTVETFVLGPKAIFAAEAYVLGLFQLYPTLYFHKATRGAEKLFTELLFRVISLVVDGSADRTALPDTHPLVRFARDPDSLEAALALDDAVVWGALALMADASDPLTSNFAVRLRDRRLYKCIDIRSRLRPLLGDIVEATARTDKVCESVKERVQVWVSENPVDCPRILIDEATREPYKPLQESKGPLNQIRIRTSDGELVDLGVRSPIVRAIEPFRLSRICFSDSDTDARAFIENTIAEEAKNENVEVN
jgi:uncharacterized protein